MSGSKAPQPVTTSPSDLDHHLGYLKLAFIAGHYAALAQQAAHKEWPHIDYLAKLVEGEADVRRDRATKSRIRLARFPVIKTVDQFRWDWPTRMNRLQVQNHFRLQFISDKSNLILLGGVGLGKSRLVEVLRQHASGQGATRLVFRCSPYYQQSALYPVIDHLQRFLHWDSTDAPEARLEALEQALRTSRLPLAEVIPLLAALLSLPHPAHYPRLNLTPQRQRQKTYDALMAGRVPEPCG